MEDDVRDELAFLTQSPSRLAILDAVRRDGAEFDRVEAARSLDVSRRTVSRALEAFVDRGYVRDGGDGYDLTAFGAAVGRACEDVTADVAVAARIRPFLANVDRETVDLDPRHLADADLVVATESSPYAVFDRSLELRRSATCVRELAPGVEQKSVDQLAERVRAGEDLDVEVVLTADAAADAGSNPDYRSAHRTVLGAPDVEMFVHPEPFRFFLGVFDDAVALGASRDGHVHAMVVSGNAAVREWADRTYRTYRERSEALAV